MNTVDIAKLNQQFAIRGSHNNLSISAEEGGIPVIDIQNEQASASICLQGAHLLSWIPDAHEEVIWLSSDAKIKAGKSIRGGIPVCWPWFGAHKSNPQFPAHGFARTSLWDIFKTEALENGSTRISLSLQPKVEIEHLWLPVKTVQLHITVGKKLELELFTHNNSNKAITIGQAFHTYFKVADVSQLTLHGLEDTDYLDKLHNFERKKQTEAVAINQEVDRIYVNTDKDCVIQDRLLNRNIIIKKSGSNSTVVWNPWQATAAKMGDLGENGYKTMLCVESCNAADDEITIEPGKVHQLWVQYEVQHID